MNLY
ncbi:hypothetical protein ACHAXA_000823 [Cyclostephanos tholiformis]|jgi:hypothetical protein